MQVHSFFCPWLRPGKLVEPVQHNEGVMTVHTKLIMSVSLQNKGERHVQPQQGPKLIPQPQSRHTAQHADGQTCRHTCADSRASSEMYVSWFPLHSFVPIFRLHAHKHTFNFLNTILLRLCNVCALQIAPSEHLLTAWTLLYSFHWRG